MEFLRAGEALLRSSQPLLPFLAPSAYRSPSRVGTTSRHCRPHQWQPQSARRTFISSHNLCHPVGAAAPRQNDRQSQTSAASNDPFASLLDDALSNDKGVPGAPAGRTSRFKSPSAQQVNRVNAKDATSAVDELLQGMLAPKPQPKPSQPRSDNRSSVLPDIESMLDPNNNTSLNPTPEPPSPNAELQPSPIKLGSTVGRTIPVEPERGIDVGRAFRMLDMRCAQNSVRKDFQRQRFHERPGLKRKRLKSERWRRRFKEQFKGTVGMVMRLKRQGW